MSTRLVHRPARSTRSIDTGQPRVIETPPPGGKGAKGRGNAMQTMMPVVGVLGSVGMMSTMRTGTSAVIGVGVLFVTVLGAFGMAFSQRGRSGKESREQRNRYLDYLERLREDFGKMERTNRKTAVALNPPADALVDCVRDPARLWERRRSDSDFLLVRCATGRMPVVPATLASSGSMMDPPDPFMMAEAEALARRFALMPDMPLTIPLDLAGNVSIVGDRDGVVRIARALLLQAAVFHAPEDLEMGACFPPATLPQWQWVGWLPHAVDPERREGPHPFRRIAQKPSELADLIREDVASRATLASEAKRGSLRSGDSRRMIKRLLVLHDTYGDVATDVVTADETLTIGELGVTVLHLVADRMQEPSNVAIRITVQDGEVLVEDLRGGGYLTAQGRLDDTPLATAEGLARTLSPLRLSADSLEEDASLKTVDFMGLLQIEDPGDLNLAQMWVPRHERSFLRVPLGLDSHGQPVVLDLKESAQLGMGPHGLCIGATGSGKSEVLRTLVMGLLATHSPEDLAMVLIDYKGGATFAPFEGVPHVAGIITNLVDDPSLTERAYASLAGEVQRRQQMLKDAGNVANITDYRLLRKQRPDMPAYPHLFVLIDEFGELLTARPDFIDLFLSIGRIGRSIGVHLLLASQRVEGGKLRGLETYLSYRLGLRTFSEEESRTVLDTDDAFHLPPLPGFGYLKVDTSVYQRFRAAYVSGPYKGRVIPEEEKANDGPAVRPYLVTPYQQPDLKTLAAEDTKSDEDDSTERTTGPTVLGVFVDQVKPAGTPVPQVWLPPLPKVCTLDQVGGPVDITGSRGLQFAVKSPPMSPAIGVIDDPRKQAQSVFRLDLTVAGGHCALVGGPSSGKTTFLRTVVTSLAHSYTPQEVAVYAIDLAGGGLAPLADLPHVGGVAIRTDREKIRRTLEEVRGMLDEREVVFRDRGIDTMERLRSLHAAGQVPELPVADVVLILDNYGAIKTTFDELEEPIADLVQRGSSYGIHLVTAMVRWTDVRMATQALFGTVLELRLNDPADSNIDRRLQETMRNAGPGRVLIPRNKLFGQLALPRVDSMLQDDDLSEAMQGQALALGSAWQGPTAPKVRVLPLKLERKTLPTAQDEPETVPIGMDETAMAPVLLDLFERDGNLVIFGDTASGKTNLLKLIMQQLIDRYSSDEVVFAVMDPRRGLRGFLPDPYLGGYATSGRVGAGLAAGVSSELEKRLPDDTNDGAIVPVPGPKVIVVADDYDLLTSGGQAPMDPFLPYVASGRDINLHFVITRRASGAGRALYEPFLTTVMESGTAGLVLSGDKSEGALFTGAVPGNFPAGRGLFVRRGERPYLIQTALADGTASADESDGGGVK
ncbi:MAG TPA: type VII secretion protein EccCa [Kribbella sp.]|uniref:type VII secretion protein EccCa n=1 Tax=Kribbella sp. TaxID=1871183 RepID=UPI002D79F355|nr:type VII secretion protein EccCa [Kribbella sp.]HET6295429.1 type VII secretion protein EccCa [Kribbella sp.]